MGSRDDFWSDLYGLARAIETQGCGPYERISTIAMAFDGLIPVAKEEVRSDLAFVISELQALQGHITVASAVARRQLTA